MTSTASPEQNEYEESFKRFKTLFIVGAACFCVGVTVVILGNRFQLYEVQRLGIIFSSFGIGWIVLAISYLVYMKWCFIPGESENTPQQVVERNVVKEGSIVPRTLGRPHSSSKALEASPLAEEKTLGRNSSPAGRSYGRSTSLVSNLQRSSPSGNGFERRPLHSSRNFERRSYSLRHLRDRPYGRDSKRLTSSFKDFVESPLSPESDLDKRIPFLNNNGKPLERISDKLPFLQENTESPTRDQRYFARTSYPEKHHELASSLSKSSNRPPNELRNERQSLFVNKSERQLSLVHSSEGQKAPVKDFEGQSRFVIKSKRQPSLVHSSEGQLMLAKNPERPTFMKDFEKRPNSNFETKPPVRNREIQPNALEKGFERQMSLAKIYERQATLEFGKRQTVSMKHSCTCPARSYRDSLQQEENLSSRPLVQKDDASQSCKIDLDTKHQGSSPPDYYTVVLSLQKTDA